MLEYKPSLLKEIQKLIYNHKEECYYRQKTEFAIEAFQEFEDQIEKLKNKKIWIHK